MALSYPVTIVIGMEIRFLEDDALYKGRASFQVLGAFGGEPFEYQFTGPTLSGVFAQILAQAALYSAAKDAPLANEEP